MEGTSILHSFTNIYFAIFALFCFKLLIKISLALLTHFYIVKGNRKEAARIAEEIYGIVPGSWADRSPLHDAAFQGRLLSLKTLIAQGFNVNLLTTDRVSALHEACLGGHVACAKVLLENGAQVSPGDDFGTGTPGNGCSLHQWECWMCCPDGRTKMQVDSSDRNVEKHNSVLFPWVISCVVQVQTVPAAHQISPGALLTPGASVNVGKRLDTPLHAAARKSSVEIVVLLIDYGADPKCRNADLKCALDLATPHSKVEQALLLREGPASLAQLCRLCIRRHLGRSCLCSVPKLHLPEPLENFLLHR
ncbi:ASB11 protein, partial [Spizella passerina]|nr:ASB11 protein [Spizella passerina]